MRSDTKAILAAVGNPGMSMVPCEIVTTDPLVVLLNDVEMAGVKAQGYTYVPGAAAYALWSPPTSPLIIPVD